YLISLWGGGWDDSDKLSLDVAVADSSDGDNEQRCANDPEPKESTSPGPRSSRSRFAVPLLNPALAPQAACAALRSDRIAQRQRLRLPSRPRQSRDDGRAAAAARRARTGAR